MVPYLSKSAEYSPRNRRKTQMRKTRKCSEIRTMGNESLYIIFYPIFSYNKAVMNGVGENYTYISYQCQCRTQLPNSLI